jgi:ATP-dependent helicase HrpA
MINGFSRLSDSSIPTHLPTSSDLDSCLIGDRQSFRRHQRALSRRAQRGQPIDQGLGKLWGAIRQSQSLLKRRRAQVPAIAYPAELPVSERRDEVAALIRDHQVVVLCGETG